MAGNDMISLCHISSTTLRIISINYSVLGKRGSALASDTLDHISHLQRKRRDDVDLQKLEKQEKEGIKEKQDKPGVGSDSEVNVMLLMAYNLFLIWWCGVVCTELFPLNDYASLDHVCLVELIYKSTLKYLCIYTYLLHISINTF
jgi:hypothetical protein